MEKPDPPLSDGRGSATYLITFSCYGQHLHGDDRGSVDRLHNQAGSRLLALDEPRHTVEKALMKEPPYRLDAATRHVVLRAIQEVCKHRGWILDACHVRATHVHVVVTSEAKADKVMNDFKAYSSRALNRLGEKRDRRWARQGSDRWISGRERVVAAIRYVIEGQGEPMAVWPQPAPERRASASGSPKICTKPAPSRARQQGVAPNLHQAPPRAARVSKR